MPILSYVPEKKTILDHRKPDGGYYTAKCDVCGTDFYPLRSSAKYCSPKCAVSNHRSEKASMLAQGGQFKSKTSSGRPKSNLGNSKPAPVKPIEPGKVFVGRDMVVGYIREQEIHVHGLKSQLIRLNEGEEIAWQGYVIKKISSTRYSVN